MSFFLLPKYFYDELNGLVAQFWWNGSDEGRKIHWLTWDKLCLPKCDRGLGFRNLHAFNLGMLAKQGWKLSTEPNSLVIHVLRAKYFPSSFFFQAKVKLGDFFVWRRLCASRECSLGDRDGE